MAHSVQSYTAFSHDVTSTILGSLSNDDGDGNANGKKAIGLD